MADITIDSSGEIINKVVTNANKVTIFKVNDFFIDVNNKLATVMYGECLYFNRNIYMYLEEGVRNVDGILLPGFNDKYEVMDYLTNIGNLIVKSYDGDLLLTRKEFKTVFNFLSNIGNYDPLLKHILDHIESYIMMYDHIEADTVRNDALGISDHIKLADTLAISFDTFSEFVVHQFDINDIVLIEEISRAYTSILGDVYEHIDLSNLNSISIKYESNIIRVTEFETPSARRYKLNCEITEGKDDGGGDV